METLKSNDGSKEGGIHKESIAKVFSINEKRIPFVHQETLANCGPLSIVNGIQALKNVNEKFIIPSDFPISSQGIRKLLSENEELRTTVFGTRKDTEIKQDNHVVESGHIANIIKKLESGSSIKITGDRFSAHSGFRPDEISDKIKNSDWLICHKNFHFTSFVRLDENNWVSLDSMSNEPIVVTQKSIEDSYTDIPQKYIAYFMSMKVEDGIKITPKEKQEILITKKESPKISIKKK